MRIGLLAFLITALIVMGLTGWTQEQEGTSTQAEGSLESSSEEEYIAPLDEQEEQELAELIGKLSNMNARRAKNSIVKLGPAAVPVLVENINSEDVVQTQQIIEVLSRIEHPSALPALEKLVQDNNRWIRAAAVYAIGEIGGQKATPILIRSLEDPTCNVCEVAIQTLIKLNDPRAIPALIEALRNNDPRIVNMAANALVTLCEGAEDFGTDWMSWQLWYESEVQKKSGSSQDL
jgi:HEAT repeat protein